MSAVATADLRELAAARSAAAVGALVAAGVKLTRHERTLVDDAVRLAVNITCDLAGAPEEVPVVIETQERDSAGRRRVARCGELGGAARHRRLGEEVCPPCLLAESTVRRGQRHKQKGAPRPLDPCGTPGAAQRHYKAGEELDQPCAAARRRAVNERAAAARERRDLEAAVWGVAA